MSIELACPYLYVIFYSYITILKNNSTVFLEQCCESGLGLRLKLKH